MASTIKGACFDYSDLDKQGHLGNNAEYAISYLRDLVSAGYPDNSRDSEISEIEDNIRYARVMVSQYLTELERLMVIAKGGK